MKRPTYHVLMTAMLSSCAVLTACNDNDDTAVAVATPSSISLEKIGGYASGVFDGSAAEIAGFDAASQRGFVVNAEKGMVDVLDLSEPSKPVLLGTIDAKQVATGAVVNSVAVQDGVVAVAIEAANKTDTGFAAFYKASDLSFMSSVAVGALPDMISFSPDGNTVLVANEGEPSDDYQIDPEGSVSVIDVSNMSQPVVRTADFTAWNDKADELRSNGVRVFGPSASVAQDLEPEYITMSDDGKTAWVSLQENNALAKLDVASATITDILPLGFKDHGMLGNALDVSDKDDAIDIQRWAGVRGLYMPDAISSYRANDGKTYIVSANEGDSRAWGEDNKDYWGEEDGQGDASKGFVEEFRVKHLVSSKGFDARQGDDLPPQLRALAQGAELNPATFAYCGATAGDAGTCRDDEQLGRLTVTWTEGYQKNIDGTPKLNERGNLVYDHLYAFGGRSFSIWDENGQLVWDSGAQFEQTVADMLPKYFNSGHDEVAFDSRSDAKGPEPEGVAVGKLGDKTFAFVGLERMGGVMVYDITDPTAANFVQYINSKDFTATEQQLEDNQAGDLGAEGVHFIAADASPTGEPLLMVANEVSGTTAIFQINQTF